MKVKFNTLTEISVAYCLLWSSFQVTVSENHGTVEAYTGWDAATYKNTLTLPTRPSNDYYTLEDINISGMALQGEHLNILAAVKKVAIMVGK